MSWSKDDPCGNEAGKVKYEIVQYTRGQGLDLGCGPDKAFPHFIGVDSRKDTALFNIQMKPDVTGDCEKLMFVDESMDFVFSSHLLEHIEDYKAALVEWWRVIKQGGHLVLYLPHKGLYPNIGATGANPDHKHDFEPDDILKAMRNLDSMSDFGRLGFEVMVNEVRSDDMEYSFLLVLRKDARARTISNPIPYIGKTACVVRYGGFGDQLQAANILPELKRQGYRVTFMTTPKGKDILLHDPHIDEWYLQDNDQVANKELSLFWEVHQKKYDKWINLSESVEGALLAMPGRMAYLWTDKMRRKHLGHNYLEFIADLADLPYQSEAKFYPSTEETTWVDEYLAESGAKKPFNVLWALSGSSVHKFTPHQDTIIMRMLVSIPELRLTFVGDEACQILEAGWEKEKRIRCMSNKMSIRKSLALAQRCDMVIGPETGILNSVGFEENAKVVFLSHSSKRNLTKHWINTYSAEPTNTPCYPCHKLHYGRGGCPIHEETGSAMCQWNTNPDDVYLAIMQLHSAWLSAAKPRLEMA